MKCKDCNSMCKYRSSDAEKECFYSKPQHDNLSTELKTYGQVDEEKHWQDVRERAAIAAMQSILTSDAFRNAKIDTATNIGELPEKEIAATSIRFANALVKRLKKEA